MSFTPLPDQRMTNLRLAPVPNARTRPIPLASIGAARVHTALSLVPGCNQFSRLLKLDAASRLTETGRMSSRFGKGGGESEDRRPVSDGGHRNRPV